jgi:hypothetical protein
MTLAVNNVDFYDIEIINGINIGVSMTPTNAAPSPDTQPYNCGAPGSKYPRSSNMGACSWSFKPPLVEY